MRHSYITHGTCSRAIEFEIDENGCLHNVTFAGGCNGNLRGIGALIEGMKATEAAQRLRGIKCGVKGTSCPDQLAAAIDQL